MSMQPLIFRCTDDGDDLIFVESRPGAKCVRCKSLPTRIIFETDGGLFCSICFKPVHAKNETAVARAVGMVEGATFISHDPENITKMIQETDIRKGEMICMIKDTGDDIAQRKRDVMNWEARSLVLSEEPNRLAIMSMVVNRSYPIIFDQTGTFTKKADIKCSKCTATDPTFIVVYTDSASCNKCSKNTFEHTLINNLIERAKFHEFDPAYIATLIAKAPGAYHDLTQKIHEHKQIIASKTALLLELTQQLQSINYELSRLRLILTTIYR